MRQNATSSKFLALAAISALAAAPVLAQPVPAYSLETITRVPTAQLAAQLLTPADAAQVDSHEVLDGGMIQFLSGVRFYHRPQPVAADICGRRVQHVSFVQAGTAPTDQAPHQRLATPDRVIEQTQIALAPGCALAAGQAFANVLQGVSRDAGADALRSLAAARAAARAGGDLPFGFTCADDHGHGACGGDGRTVLAQLRTEQAWLIGPVRDHPDQVWIIVGEPGQLYWELRLAGGAAPTDLVMTRKVPAPF